jgi:hypothetical protein
MEAEEDVDAPRQKKARAKADAEKDEAKPSAELPVARADRLFAEGQWAAAAEAYRDLLHRFPKSPEVGRWRQRLATATAELEAAARPTAPASAAPAR